MTKSISIIVNFIALLLWVIIPIGCTILGIVYYEQYPDPIGAVGMVAFLIGLFGGFQTYVLMLAYFVKNMTLKSNDDENSGKT